MKNKDISYYLVLIIVAVAGIISWGVYLKVYTQKDTVNIHEFPKTVGEWTSNEMTITEDEYAILETHNAFAREYQTPSGKKVYLFIVYSQTNRKVSHPPEICYTGSGAKIFEEKRDFVYDEQNNKVPVNRFSFEIGQLPQVAIYWFKIGDRFTPSYWKQQAMIAFNSFSGKSASSALIRLSAIAKSGNQEETVSNIKEFSKLIIPLLPKYLP